MQNPWRRAGALYGTAGRLVIVTVVAALLVAGLTLPFVGVVGVATRDAANTFNDLSVGSLGQPPTRSTLYDSEGQPLTYFYPGDVYRVPVLYSQIAPVMRNAIVAIEDDGFYKQGALDPRGTLRALFSDSSGGQLQGGSTLAQQYVKNVRVLQAGSNMTAATAAAYPTVQRKIQQLRMAATVEHEMSQPDLLAAYLNVAYFNNHAWGIQVAAEVYFSEPASRLTLPQAALLAGIVQSPTAYNPVANPGPAKMRRDEVLTRMAQLHYITSAQATATEKLPIKLHMSAAPLKTGCLSPQVASSGFFCDYVQNVLEVNYPSIWNEIETTGGLKIYTTLNMRDQLAADHAVNYVMPHYSNTYNPNRNADTEVLIRPGTGAVKAIAIDRKFGTGPGQDAIDYAVNSNYGGSPYGVQTGSSSKIFTLITALKEGVPFGHPIKVVSPTTVNGYTNCKGEPVEPGYSLSNSEGPTTKGGQTWQLYSATVASINVYFAHLEQQVGLCQTVQTAVDMGMTRADGRPLLKYDKPLLKIHGDPESADNITSFTLGSVGVSPMNMAAAYASVAARGWYCPPQAITKIETLAGVQLPLTRQPCHRDMSKAVADAANYILKGVINSGLGTANTHSIGRPNGTAGKTGTGNSGYYAAFAGYTPDLAAYVSVFNPAGPTSPEGQMLGIGSCYRVVPGGVLSCPGQEFGTDAPGSTWEETFLHAQIGPPSLVFINPPPSSPFFREGAGDTPILTPPKKKKPPKHGGPGGPGGPPGGPGGPGGPGPTQSPPPIGQ